MHSIDEKRKIEGHNFNQDQVLNEEEKEGDTHTHPKSVRDIFELVGSMKMKMALETGQEIC